MDAVKAIAGLVGTVVIAGWVAYAVSAPRNVDNMMNQPMAALDGSSFGEEIKAAQAEARADQCERLTIMAQDAWDNAVDRGTLERDSDKLAEYDRQRDRFCN